MQQVSFLAQMVGPKIASAAAQRALEVLAEEDAEAAAAVAAELAAGNGGGPADSAGAQQAAVKPANGSNAADGVGGAVSRHVSLMPGPCAGSAHQRFDSVAAFAAAFSSKPIPAPLTSRRVLALQPPSAGRMRLAAATGLAAAAVQAKLLADQEEREVQRLVLAAVESQFKKVQAKLQVGCLADHDNDDGVACCSGRAAASSLCCSFRLCVGCPFLPGWHASPIPTPSPYQLCLQYLEELDGLMAAERLTLEAMRGRLIDDYQQAVAENAKAGLAPPPGRALASEAATAEASEPSAAVGPAEQQAPAAMQ
jgi:hypothetical protein